MDIICVGEVLVDFTPGPKPFSYVRNAGGAPANVAVAAARTGCTAGFCGKVGCDGFGRFLTDTLIRNGVVLLGPEPAEEAFTTMAFVTLGDDGERSFEFARKPGADMLLMPGDIREEDIAGCTVLHAGSCSLSAPPASAATIHAMKMARRFGRLVSFDVNYRDQLWKGGGNEAAKSIAEVLPYIDFLKVSEEEAELLGGENAVRRFMGEDGVTLAVETLGEKGAKVFFSGRTYDLPGFPVSAVDTTGAGDAFWGAFLSHLISNGVKNTGMLSRPVVLEAARRGNIAGALCVQKHGAMPSLPTNAEIDAFATRNEP